jgi:hypothetical protein
MLIIILFLPFRLSDLKVDYPNDLILELLKLFENILFNLKDFVSPQVSIITAEIISNFLKYFISFKFNFINFALGNQNIL